MVSKLEQRLMESATSEKLKHLHTPNQDGYLPELARLMINGRTKECIVSLDLGNKVHELYRAEGNWNVGPKGAVQNSNTFYIVESEKVNQKEEPPKMLEWKDSMTLEEIRDYYLTRTKVLFYEPKEIEYSEGTWLIREKDNISFDVPFNFEQHSIHALMGSALGAGSYYFLQNPTISLVIPVIFYAPRFLGDVCDYRKMKKQIRFYEGLIKCGK